MQFDSPELKLDLKTPEKFGNVADKLDETVRNQLAQHIIDLVKIDESSMAEWVGKAQGYLNKVNEDTNTAAPQKSEQQGSSESSPPSTALTMSAVIQFTARITGSILSEPDLVRASEPGGEALAEWMSSQLRTTDPDWVNDTDPMTMHMAVTGLAWRKRWFDQHDSIYRTTWLPSTRKGVAGVIINANTKSLERTPRITHPIEKYPYEISRSIQLGHWVDYGPRFDDVDPQALQKFYETDLWIDLDGDEKDEPWTLTISLEDTPTVIKIEPRWSRKSVVDTNKLLMFRPVRRYYAYRMIPDPEGSFLPKGFGWLLNRVEQTADRLLASIDDTAKSASENGGIISTGGVGIPDKIELVNSRLTTVNTDGRPITEMLSMFPQKQVTPGMVGVLDKVLTLGDRLAGTLNLLENAPASMTATMAKGIIDTGSQVQGAVHRRIIGEMTEEMRAFGKLADDMDKLPPNVVGTGPVAVSADPNMSTEMHRGVIGQVYHDMLSLPMVFDPQEVGRRYAETMRLPQPQKLVKMMGPQQPNPKEQAEIAVKVDKNAIDKLKVKGTVILQIAQAVLALSQAGVNAKNAELVAAEIDKLNAAIEELKQDATSNGIPNPGSDAGAGGAPQNPEDAQGSFGAGLPTGQSGGPSPAGAGGGTAPPVQLANAAG